MDFRRFTAVLALAVTAGAMSVSPALADAPAVTTLYVDNGNANCTDSGTGTAAAPFCTIQAAANAADPGQTVLVDPSTPGESYHEDVTVTRSGTAGKPITFLAGLPVTGYTTHVAIQPSPGQTLADGFDLSGVHDIVISGFTVSAAENEFSVADSSDITINRVTVGLGASAATGVSITGDSSGVTVSRSVFSTEGQAVSIGSGASDVTVSTNRFNNVDNGQLVSVAGATGTAITSNTWIASCNQSLAVTGSTGTTIENNLVYGGCTEPTTTAVISVDAASAPTTKLDYNIPYRLAPGTLYSWAGSPYSSAAALTSATGQGAHDLNVNPGSLSPSTPAVDSADASAPGELPTDILGNARVDDPQVADTGTGVGYVDRGAVELQDLLRPGALLLSATQAPTGATVTASLTVNSPWTSGVTAVIQFGDGSAGTAVSGLTSTATHVYTTPGTYTATATITDSLGTTVSTTRAITVVAPAPLQASVSVVVDSALSVTVDPSATTDSWNLTQATIDYGDGTGGNFSQELPLPTLNHTYAKSGTYTITLTVTDAGGFTSKASKSYTTTGSDYTPYGPVRLLDTRAGTGTGGVVAKVPADGTVKLKISGNGTIPAGVTAVALNLTVTGASGSGFVSAYADGSTLPNVSNLNYTQGTTVPASAIVPVGADGSVDLTNQGATAGPIDLIADVTGYFSLNGTEGYSQIAPTRLLDTRGGSPAAPNKPVVLTLATGNYLPPAGVDAVTLNLTATDTHGTGNVTVFPDGESMPNSSNLNFTAGRTVANAVLAPVGQDGKIDLEINGTTAGPGDLIVDVTGYFSTDNPNAYVPITPTRLLDTRGSAPLAAGGTALAAPVAGGVADVVNVTVTQPAGSGFVTAFSAGADTVPNVSTLDYSPGATVANLAVVIPGSIGIDPTPQLAFYNGGATAGKVQLIVDEFGYFAS